MNATITIGQPILQPGEHFEASYALLPNGVPVDVGDETNAPFTITGLSDGDYQLTVVYVRADGSECDPTVTGFTVARYGCECPAIDELYVQRSCKGGAIIHVSFSGTGDDICSYIISYSNFGSTVLVPVQYAVLPQSIDIPIPDNGVGGAPLFGVSVMCCDSLCGGITKCTDVSPIIDIRECQCAIGPKITSSAILYNGATSQWYIALSFSGSVMDMPPYTITYQQQGAIGAAPVNIVTETGAGTFDIDVFPVPYNGTLSYSITVSNTCGTDNTVIDGVPLFVDCDVFLVWGGDDNGKIYLYRDGHATLVVQQTPQFSQYTDIAIISDKMYAIRATGPIDIWDMGANSITLNTENAFTAAGAGLGTDGTYLYYQDGTDILRSDPLSWSPQVTGYGDGSALQGDIMQIGDNFLISSILKNVSSLQTWKNVFGSSYIGMEQVIVDASNNILPNISGMFQVAGTLYLLQKTGNIYSYDTVALTATLLTNVNVENPPVWNGAAQRAPCGTVTFPKKLIVRVVNRSSNAGLQLLSFQYDNPSDGISTFDPTVRNLPIGVPVDIYEQVMLDISQPLVSINIRITNLVSVLTRYTSVDAYGLAQTPSSVEYDYTNPGLGGSGEDHTGVTALNMGDPTTNVTFFYINMYGPGTGGTL